MESGSLLCRSKPSTGIDRATSIPSPTPLAGCVGGCHNGKLRLACPPSAIILPSLKTESLPPPEPVRRSRLARLLRKALILALVTVLFGWFYAWAAPWAFPINRTAGFGYGVLHGALMPIALPSLVIGKDVPIFASNNSGRLYKIGYICGINLCGLVFFGSLFWRPKR